MKSLYALVAGLDVHRMLYVLTVLTAVYPSNNANPKGSSVTYGRWWTVAARSQCEVGHPGKHRKAN